MTTPMETTSDSDLWALVITGDAKSFEAIVSRYKNLLCSVAYSRCGDFALSEDLAQDAFWAAWESRDSLREPERLRSWLCGIVRNLVAGQQRKASNRHGEYDSHEPVESSSSIDDPAITAISREEESLVWQSLEEIPETYREPLVLFYREEQSVAEVALAMDLTEDAVKQRLSRGRAMLRDRMADVVEGALRQTRPTTAFTVAVMAGIAASAGSKSVLASGGTVAAASAASAVLGATGKVTVFGVLGGLAGAMVGLAGGYLGLAVPAMFAPTRHERDYLMRCAKRTTLVSFGLIILLLVLIPWERSASPTSIGITVLVWNAILSAYICLEVAIITRAVGKIRQKHRPDEDPNDSVVKAWVVQQKESWERREYCSSWTLLGIPLVKIGTTPRDKTASKLAPWTTAWIAIGDKAQGFIAIGGRARGFLAMGGLSYGVVAFGGVTAGVLTFGGAGIGIVALGGGAIGWQAFGGLAIAVDLAVGGCAVALRAAHGGAAFARDYAIGGSASASHANDAIARQILDQEPLVRLAQWQLQHQALCTILVFAFSVIWVAFVQAVAYRRKRVAPVELNS